MELRSQLLDALMKALITLWVSFSFLVAASPGTQASPGPRGAGEDEPPRILEQGQSVGNALTVGEAHTYEMALDSAAAATVVLEREGVAVVATLYGPDGRRVETFGSPAIRRGTETFRFVAESAGRYRLTLRTFFQPSPPGRYLLTFAGVHTASLRERAGLTLKHCEEKPWLDREGNFLVDEALDSISQCITAVGEKLEAQFPEATALAGAANAEASYLAERWHWGEFVSTAYQEGLTQNFRMLAVAAGEPDPKRAFAILQSVAEDLSVKADHCRKSNRGLGGDVQVEVRTRAGSEEQPGWVVYYKLGIFEFARGRPPERFPAMSSPTSFHLPAAIYLMWAAKPGEPEPLGREERIRVGGGLPKLTIDLFIP